MRPVSILSTILAAGCGLFIGAAVVAAAYRRREPAYNPPLEERLPPGVEYRVGIAPRSDALTFARLRRDGAVHLMLVDRYEGGTLSGILVPEVGATLYTDPIDLFVNLGYKRAEGLGGTSIEVLERELIVPFEGTAAQIAIGGNYPKHAAETSLSANFLFPKLLPPGGFLEDVPAGRGLLDHEVELGFVSLERIKRGDSVKYMGLVLASDYTDRATLLRSVDPRKVSSGRGFTEAKSKTGYMPVGNLFVIPKDVRSFYRSLEMRLYVDGQLHQFAAPSEMIWDMDRMMQQAFLDEGESWQYQGRQISLPIENGILAARTIILSGTSDGVLLRKPSTWQLALGLLEVAIGGFRDVQATLVEPTIRKAHEDHRYLQPGMQVVMRADKLGVIRNRIVS